MTDPKRQNQSRDQEQSQRPNPQYRDEGTERKPQRGRHNEDDRNPPPTPSK